jgi:uncharacterized protein involved in exopolysaccharide biosynthesis
MSSPFENNAMLRSQRLFERLLSLYPRAHRNEYGPAMAQVFRDQCRDVWRDRRTWGLVSLWLQVLPDLVETSILEHLSTLKGRKSMLEKFSEITSPSTAPLKTFFAVFAIVFLLVFGATAVITFLLPETYASAVRIKIEPNAAARGQQGSPSVVGVYDPYLIQTEFEILQSAAVLGEVAEQLDLSTKWARSNKGGEKLTTSETVQLLRSRVELRSIRNTTLIELRAFSEEPNEAAAVANAMADVYYNNRVEESRQLALRGINILEQRFDEQEQKIREAQMEVDELRKHLGISGSDTAGDSSTPTLEAETVRQLHSQLMAAESHLARERTTLSELEKLSADQRRDAIQTVVGSDNELGALLVEHNLAQQRLLAVQNAHTPDHPTSRNAARMLDQTAKRINERAEGIMIGLRSRVSASQAAVEDLQAKLNKARQTDIENAERSRPYFEAKLRLEELMRYRAALNLKLASERLDAELPKAALVEIVDRAFPHSRPVRPNKPMILFLGAVAGCLLGAMVGVAVTRGFTIRRKAPSQAAA